MNKRSPQYPQITLLEAKNFSVNVYEKAGDSTPLKYNDLAKFGKVALRMADTCAAGSKLYGWMASYYGKGYSPVGSICTVLRKPQGNEEKEAYIKAFTLPEIYQKIINEYQGKAIPPEGLEIYLIRNHDFSDTGAKLCGTVFLENAKFLGLINSDGIFNSEGEITITEPEEKAKKTKSISHIRKPSVEKEKNTNNTPKQIPPPNQPPNGIGNTGRTITIFIKGKRYLWDVPTNMNQADWDDIEVQIKQLKEVAK